MKRSASSIMPREELINDGYFNTQMSSGHLEIWEDSTGKVRLLVENLRKGMVKISLAENND